MNKVSAQKVQQLLAQASQMVKQAAVEIAERDLIIEQYRSKESASKIANAMRDKNIVPSWALTEDDAVGHIMSMAPEKRAAVQAAVDMAAPQDPFAHLDVSRDSDHPEGGRVKGASAFEQFVFGNL